MCTLTPPRDQASYPPTSLVKTSKLTSLACSQYWPPLLAQKRVVSLGPNTQPANLLPLYYFIRCHYTLFQPNQQEASHKDPSADRLSRQLVEVGELYITREVTFILFVGMNDAALVHQDPATDRNILHVPARFHRYSAGPTTREEIPTQF